MNNRALTLLLMLALAGCAPKPSAETVPPEMRYEHQIVRRAGDSVEDAKVYAVVNHKKCWIIHAEWLGKHGYKWPEDVKIIPAAELASIPLGEPLDVPLP